MVRTLLLSGLVLIGCPAAGSCADSVWDPAEIAHLVNKAAQSALSLAQLVETVTALQSTALALGQGGAGWAAGAPNTLRTDGLSAFAPGAAAPGAVAAVQRVVQVTAGSSQLSDVLADRRQVESLWSDAVVNGLASAFYFVGDVQQFGGDQTGLRTSADSASDIRSDVQANTAASLAVLATLIKMRTILQSVVEMEALDRAEAGGGAP